jgi:hypothetical protein
MTGRSPFRATPRGDKESIRKQRADLRRKERDAILAAYQTYEQPGQIATDDGRVMSVDWLLGDE